MEYTELSTEQQEATLKATIAQIENQHYSTTLALERAKITSSDGDQEILEAELEKLEAQHTGMLAKLDKDFPQSGRAA